ncbi:MAG: 50S ribosomal protein L10 [Bacteriovoracia bacterium]
MNSTEKAEWAKNFKTNLEKSKVAIFADYKGLKATQADDLRKKLREKNAKVQVLKNNIARQAVKGDALGAETVALLDSMVGPTLVAFAFGDPAAAAKVINDFAKDNEAFNLKDSWMERKRVPVAQVQELANLPSREVLLAKMLGTMNAPITNFACVLAAVPRSLLNVLVALEKKKQG